MFKCSVLDVIYISWDAVLANRCKLSIASPVILHTSDASSIINRKQRYYISNSNNERRE